MNTASHYYTEETRCFGPDQRLIGTLTLPRSPAMRPMPGLILLNAGVLPRIGPHRLNVELARTAALHGVPAIRFDFPGLGDSGFSTSTLPHDEQALVSIEHAMHELGCTVSAPDQFLIAGLCSGADVGLMMAKRDTRVVGLFMIEPYYYPNALSGALRIVRRLKQYGLRRALTRMLELHCQAGTAPSNQAGPTRALPMNPEEDARSTPSARAFAQDMAILLKRGVHLELIYANSLMGRFDLWRHQSQIFRPLRQHRHFHVELVADTDHSFTRIAARKLLVSRMTDWIKENAHLHASARLRR
ncbi:MAG: hypothetical protein Q4B17_03230 [Lautropia sp.]|nr:hypothetical protein [Lautropia sp.]